MYKRSKQVSLQVRGTVYRDSYSFVAKYYSTRYDMAICSVWNTLKRNRLVASLSTSCNNAVILSSCYKVVTHNLSTNCWIAGRWQVVGTTCNKSVELNNLVASCQQVVTMLLFYQVATRLSLTTCRQIVELQDDDKLLEQLVTSLLSSTTL
jgi:hypothetical protein